MTWLIALLAAAIGGGAGFYFGQQKSSSRKELDTLREELEATKKDHSQYRQDVSQHFEKTSELFTQMTQDYRSIYEHLATGAQALCFNGERPKQVEFPERPLFESSGHSATPESKETTQAEITPSEPEAPRPSTPQAKNTASEEKKQTTHGPKPTAAELDAQKKKQLEEEDEHVLL
ncbi:MAG: YhcB family protein [Gammaproteobacteria bacterium]|nr:YhcB family protein [Gammaproteobacteria bacterium]